MWRPLARFAAAPPGGPGSPPGGSVFGRRWPQRKLRQRMTACEELADGEAARPPFHEKRGPRPKVAAMERRKARHLPLKVPKTKMWRQAALHPPGSPGKAGHDSGAGQRRENE